jgi:hypothetical protein
MTPQKFQFVKRTLIGFRQSLLRFVALNKQVSIADEMDEGQFAEVRIVEEDIRRLLEECRPVVEAGFEQAESGK